MKKILFQTVLFFFLSVPSLSKSQTIIADTATMRQGYSSALYFNLRTGEKTPAPINAWDMAHTTVSRDNCIRINHMNGIEVYAYPKGDNSAYSSMDTSGWPNWKKYYNNTHVHELGALNQSVNKKNMWDFSWGVYDPTTKIITGDSLYLLVISIPNTGKSFLKFMPIAQLISGDFIFKLGSLDGTINRTDTLLQSDFTGNSYKYYSFTKGKVQVEPLRDNYDILFTRYLALTVPPGGGSPVFYPTMGVESKRGTRISKIANYTWSEIDQTPAKVLDEIKTPGNQNELSKDLTKIGSNWKSYDNATMTWKIERTWTYIVESVRNQGKVIDTAYWMIGFSGFSGSGKGDSYFNRQELKGRVSAVSKTNKLRATVFPNPAEKELLLWISTESQSASIKLLGLDGRVISSLNALSLNDSTLRIPIEQLASGSYRILVQTPTEQINLPFIKQ